ncbi:gluconeogenesis factor YvcK family protein [Sediminivirga luteola]|uniref:gluconeogenesis factor YvcK family protein n=1 Tax=Sediminivirga luteola TaxID=1774748 RepID=UPI001F59531B|nr:uridine diphosphate-N-acetylglucosamine-binding protein YvcK [Sediminivirga luteola]
MRTEEVPILPARSRDSSGPKIVAFGGGHGLYAALRAFRLLTERLTAVVTVADDGGSSGRLREEFGTLPPGDLRMALAALCDDGEWGRTWRDVIQHRFSSAGDLGGHSVGNLLITALWELLDDHVDGLDWMARLLRAHGRVLPMSSVPLTIEADVSGLDPGDPALTWTIRGQSRVAVTTGHVEHVRLDPPRPPAREETIQSVREADVLNLGPGSWYTSVMTHLLVPDLHDAIRDSSALKLLTLNVHPGRGETRNLSMTAHLESLHRHAPELRVDWILADERIAEEEPGLAETAHRLFGARLWRGNYAVANRQKHDSLKLAAGYRDVLIAEDIVVEEQW